jgi:signal transduction histidine kinase
MKAITTRDMLEAAAFALVSERCRASYVHDIRGGLHALYGGVELLSRAAKNPDNGILADKAAGLARSALAKHEKSLIDLVDQLSPRQEAAVPVNVGELVGEILRFIRNDVANKSVTFRLQTERDIVVLAEAHKIRLLLLGLSITLTDGLDPGTVIDVSVTRSSHYALIEFASFVSSPTVPELKDIWGSTGPVASARELLLSLSQAWASDNGGRLELTGEPTRSTGVRLYYPAILV